MHEQRQRQLEQQAKYQADMQERWEGTQSFTAIDRAVLKDFQQTRRLSPQYKYEDCVQKGFHTAKFDGYLHQNDMRISNGGFSDDWGPYKKNVAWNFQNHLGSCQAPIANLDDVFAKKIVHGTEQGTVYILDWKGPTKQGASKWHNSTLMGCLRCGAMVIAAHPA